MSGDRYPHGDRLWHAYRETTIRIWVDGDEFVVRAGLPVPKLPADGLIHIITAWNPGRSATVEENSASNLELAEALATAGTTVHPASGESADGSWIEDSFAVSGLTRDQAVRLGRDFGQLAIFEIDDSDVHLISCEIRF